MMRTLLLKPPCGWQTEELSARRVQVHEGRVLSALGSALWVASELHEGYLNTSLLGTMCWC
jgi:hypothetical protein